jgi:CheY-like chemotaxis protein/HPt (histidine-containing phosphotransfer) domain-containing protein
MMLTSGDHPDDMRRCNELGIKAYLLKPIKQSELLESIEMAMGIMTPAKPSLKAVSLPAMHSLRILLAEDSLVNQKVAVALLESQEHRVVVANNGRQAVAATENEPFDLVLMDLQMPEMDGLEATACIRGREKHTGKHVPIIAMTAHALKGDRERCLEAGMDGYIAKPIRSEDVLQAIGEIVPGRREAAESGVPRETPAERQEPVNWAKALESAQGQPEILATLVAAALEELPQLMAAVRSGLASGDREQVRRAAHTIKSSVRYFGGEQASQLAARMESLMQQNTAEHVEELLQTLEKEISLVIASLKTRELSR